MKIFKSISIMFLMSMILVLSVNAQWTPAIWQDFLDNGSSSRLPDFSYAGYNCGESALPADFTIAADVTDAAYGAIVNDGLDDTAAIQAAIDSVALTGGGVVYFPAGRYDINVDPANSTFIQMNNSNITLRGAGSIATGTVIYLNNKLDTQGSYGVDDSTVGAAAISIGHTLISTWGVATTSITSDALRGSTILEVADSSTVQPGNVYQLVMDGGDANDLNDHLLYPLDPASDPAWIYANGNYTHFQWLIEVAQVIDATHIELKQPTREDIKPAWNARLLRPTMLEEVGVESMRFESAWTGGYGHHDDDEVDYMWPALNMRAVRNGWIKDVVFDDYTAAVPAVIFSKNVTVKNVDIVGLAGHLGVTISRGYDCLVDSILIDARRTHPLSISTRSQGNVFRNVAINYSDGESCYQAIDFHTGYAMENLFELIDSARVQSGGDTNNLPHSSKRNTFWNVKCEDMNTPYNDDNDQEFFTSYYWSSNYVGARNDDHKLYPGSIVVGAYHDTISLEIDESSADRDTDFVYVEGLNQLDIEPASLYQAQYDIRVLCLSYLDQDINKDCVVNLEDFAYIASDWTKCNDPANVECVD